MLSYYLVTFHVSCSFPLSPAYFSFLQCFSSIYFLSFSPPSISFILLHTSSFLAYSFFFTQFYLFFSFFSCLFHFFLFLSPSSYIILLPIRSPCSVPVISVFFRFFAFSSLHFNVYVDVILYNQSITPNSVFRYPTYDSKFICFSQFFIIALENRISGSVFIFIIIIIIVVANISLIVNLCLSSSHNLVPHRGRRINRVLLVSTIACPRCPRCPNNYNCY